MSPPSASTFVIPEYFHLCHPRVLPHLSSPNSFIGDMVLLSTQSSALSTQQKGRPPIHLPPPIASPATSFRRKIMQKSFLDKPKQLPYTPSTEKEVLINQLSIQSITQWSLSMEAYQVEKRVAANSVLHLNALPFQEGELVEVIIFRRKREVRKSISSPLRGKVIKYIDPTEPVAQDDWELLL